MGVISSEDLKYAQQYVALGGQRIYVGMRIYLSKEMGCYYNV
jgi:hypothetical protein